jgi:hypothetical protein
MLLDWEPRHYHPSEKRRCQDLMPNQPRMAHYVCWVDENLSKLQIQKGDTGAKHRTGGEPNADR